VSERGALAAFVRLAAVGALAAAIGCGGGGGGGHGGSGGSFTGFGGFGLFDGGPADGGGSTGTDGPTLQPAPPICGNGIVEAAEACDGAAVTGCTAGQRCGATCACVAGPPAPTDSRALIAQALAAGRIDYFTSLLYRAYLLVGDGRLPAAYDGDFTVGEDTALFLEVSRLWSAMTPTQRAQIGPYVARPNDPTSVYSTPPTAPFFGDSGEEMLATPPAVPELACPALGPNGPPDFRHTASTHFVVWSCGSGDLATDPYVAKRQVVSALAEDVWSREEPSMGAPRNDDFPYDPENKNRIDIYLVPLNMCVTRAGSPCTAIRSVTTVAAAPPDSPCDGSRGVLTSSGYMLMRLDLVPATVSAGAAKARSDLAHEFFHLVSWGLNLEAQGGACHDTEFTGPVEGKVSWLTEASGTWAEWAYAAGDDPAYRGKWFRSFQARFPDTHSLLDVSLEGNPAYEAFVYPLFLSQEAGGRMPFESFWKNARTQSTREALDDLLNTRFPFDRHFRDFGVKMLNKTLTPGDPIAPLLSAFDAAVPPNFPPENMAPKLELPPDVHDTDLPFHVTLAPLAAQIQQFTVPPETRWVDVDLSGANAQMTMDVIANVGGTWKRRPVDGLRFTFCRDDPDDDIKEFYLVLANTAHRENAKADEDYKVKTRLVCPSTLTGTIRSEQTLTKHYIDADGTIVDQYERTRETWTLGMEHEITYGGVKFPGIDAHWHAIFSHHESNVRDCRVSTTDGEGGGSHTTPLAIMEVGGGRLVLTPVGDGDPGSFDVPLVLNYDMCGTGLTINDERTVYEQAGVVGAYTNLIPSAANPNRYTGSRVVLDSEMPLNGGMEVIEWKVTWDVGRGRR
jgi:hypothetical protein